MVALKKSQLNKHAVGRIHSLETFGALDGPGLRFVVFMQGCPLRCIYCHNPDSWDVDSGRLMTADELLSEIVKYNSFIKGGGVTFSGGEPLMQYRFVAEMLRRLRELSIHTALDTSGAVDIAKSGMAIDLADLILLDIKSLDDGLNRYITGQSNRGALETLRYCEDTGKDVWIRHVLVPGITLVEWRLRRLADYLKKFKCIKKVELLPFHKMGEYKWQELDLEYKLTDTAAVEKSEAERMKLLFSELDCFKENEPE